MERQFTGNVVNIDYQKGEATAWCGELEEIVYFRRENYVPGKPIAAHIQDDFSFLYVGMKIAFQLGREDRTDMLRAVQVRKWEPKS